MYDCTQHITLSPNSDLKAQVIGSNRLRGHDRRVTSASRYIYIGVGYLGGGTLTGTFDYNAGVFLDINISAVGGVPNGDVFDVDKGSTSSSVFASASNHDEMLLQFASALPTGGGTDDVEGLLIQPAGGILLPINHAGSVQAPVTATPIPAALPLFATGLAMTGRLGWRKKRKNAAALAAT